MLNVMAGPLAAGAAPRCSPSPARATTAVATSNTEMTNHRRARMLSSSTNPQILRSSDPSLALPALLPVDAVPQRLLRLFLRDEQIVGHPGHVPQHVGVDDVSLIEVQAEAGQILQPQVAIAVDRRGAKPGLQIGLPSGVGRKQIDRIVHPDL